MFFFHWIKGKPTYWKPPIFGTRALLRPLHRALRPPIALHRCRCCWRRPPPRKCSFPSRPPRSSAWHGRLEGYMSTKKPTRLQTEPCQRVATPEKQLHLCASFWAEGTKQASGIHRCCFIMGQHPSGCACLEVLLLIFVGWLEVGYVCNVMVK